MIWVVLYIISVILTCRYWRWESKKLKHSRNWDDIISEFVLSLTSLIATLAIFVAYTWPRVFKENKSKPPKWL